jgi:hypothetical protein
MEVRRHERLSIPSRTQTHLCILAHHLAHLREVLRCCVILVLPAVTLETLTLQDLGHLTAESMVEPVQAHPYAIYCLNGFKCIIPVIQPWSFYLTLKGGWAKAPLLRRWSFGAWRSETVM